MMTAARCAGDFSCASRGRGTDAHDLMPLAFDLRWCCAWDFWSPSPRAALALGKIEGCTFVPGSDFCRCLVAGRHGLLARSDGPVGLRVHRYRRPAILGIWDGDGQDARPPSRSPC